MNFIKKFEDVTINDINLVGGKNASLGEMIRQLSPKGLLIPSGFVITAQAYKYHLEKNSLEDKIKKLLSKIDRSNLKEFEKTCSEISGLIANSPLPNDLEDQIKLAYQEMQKKYGSLCDVAVRSSATAEDLPEASFAGQQETFLNVKGESALLKYSRLCFASLFTVRATSYRIDHGFDHMDVSLSVGVQKMVRSDMASSGVAFTLDTESGFNDVVFINSSYGLGENIVKGNVTPDEFYVHKPTLRQGFKPILKKRLGSKLIKMVYSNDPKNPINNVEVEPLERIKFSLSDDEILELAKNCLTIEQYYSDLKARWVPMDIEWAKDGIDGKIYILQARPETVHALRQNKNILEEYILGNEAPKNKILISGKSVGKKIATGKVKIIKSAKFMYEIDQGDILVTDMTDPDWEPIMKRAAGIITNRGGRTCHAAIVSRELGIPAIVGSENATTILKNGQEITMDCSSGEIGFVYEGRIPFEIKKVELSELPKPPTQIMVNVGNPDEVFNLSALPVDGVGLARLEFIINSSIKIHPMALVNPEKVEDEAIKKEIENLTFGYDDKKQFFIDKLAQEAGTIAAAFYPRPVVVRMSDFKSNEYRKLIAGKYFEPVEENPMLGFRGASRYYNKKYADAFKLECLAMKKIREVMGLTNVILMFPFVRTVKEGRLVLDEMAKYGLVKGKDGLQIYMMCELPSNVLLIDDFSQVFDGFSIGSNDLTQMVLAVDRDSDIVADIFNERDPAVKKMLEMAINGAKRNQKKIGICGQAPSDYPELSKFLVALGIDSISLNPDMVLKEILILN